MRQKLITMLTIAVGMTVAAFASPHDSCRADMARGEKLAEKLGLSDQQKSQLKDLRKEMRDFRKSQMDKMNALLEKSKTELLKPAPSKDVLYGYAKEMGEQRRIMAEKEADHLLQVKIILTPEQFTKLLSMKFWEGAGPRPDCAKDSLHAKGPHGGNGHHPDRDD
jgi:Spy/CpxP family protein refolding chaperone